MMKITCTVVACSDALDCLFSGLAPIGDTIVCALSIRL